MNRLFNVDTKDIWILDIESNSLLSDTLSYKSFPYKLKENSFLWVVVLRNVGTDEVVFACNEAITKEWMKSVLKDCKVLVAHNGLKFDFPVLNLFGVLEYHVGSLDEPDTIFNNPIIFIDSLILSRILNPDRFGGHSVDGWGKRFHEYKQDFRAICIEKGYIDKHSEKGAEFQKYCPEMLEYCIQDTKVEKKIFLQLLKDLHKDESLLQSIKVENKVADLGIKRELFGFSFNKEKALECISDLENKMKELEERVNPLLPLKRMNKGEIAEVTPCKTQFTKDGLPSKHIITFAERLSATIFKEEDAYFLTFEGNTHRLPVNFPLKTHTVASIKDMDHVKSHLISLGWVPTEWRERDLTKDAKKQSLPNDKRVKAMEKWVDETLAGKYKDSRLEILGVPYSINRDDLILILIKDLFKSRPVKVPTSPSIRVGVEKNLCPSLEALGEKVDFAKDFSLYLTYRHRLTSIAGGEEDEDGVTERGYLSSLRKEDGRIPTPAIEIGAISNRYRHISIVNVPRNKSIYGENMRSLFRCGEGYYQLGYDFSSLEARIMGHYVWKYTDGEELAKMMLAEKPNDWHSINALKLGITRDNAKSLGYGLIYGAQANKVSKMLNMTKEEAVSLVSGFWGASKALKELKDSVESFWESTGNNYIIGLDGRKLIVRSKHSILNTLFQSAGTICARYVNVLIHNKLEKSGLNINPLIKAPDAISMIEMHDESQLAVRKDLVSFTYYSTEEKAKAAIKSYKEGQLSGISIEDSLHRVALPNIVSKAIEESIKEVEILFKLNIPLGFEWAVGNNWAECH